MNLNQTAALLKVIAEETHQTGMKAYGFPTTDHDRFCTAEVYKKIQAMVMSAPPTIYPDPAVRQTAADAYPSSRHFQFTEGGELFDVFCVPDDEIELWKITTAAVGAALQALPGAVAVKALRVCLFRQTLETLKMWKRLGEGK